MARQNDTRLYGYVADEPQVTAKSTGGLARALFHLAVIRSSRDSGEGKVADRIMYDWPIILSMDEEMIETIASLHKYDVVDIKGHTLGDLSLEMKALCEYQLSQNDSQDNHYRASDHYFIGRGNTNELPEWYYEVTHKEH